MFSRKTYHFLKKYFSRIYICAVLTCPVLFYLPKFFEVRTAEAARATRFTLNCTQMRRQQQFPG